VATSAKRRLTAASAQARQSQLALNDRSHGSAWLPGVVVQGSGNAGRPGQPRDGDGDGQVAQAGPDARAAGGVDLTVLVEVDVADPVQPVLDGPGASDDGREPGVRWPG
jgi:hypothetical protein